jgi:hypothetical protein
MKVYELIEVLKEMDPQAVVECLEDSYYMSFSEITKVKQEVFDIDEDGNSINKVFIL